MIDGNAIPQIRRGLVWCTTCGRSEKVDGNATLNGRAGGWPKCCGYTMTIDSPQERAQLAGGWRTDVQNAPAKTLVDTKIHDANGSRNEQPLSRSGRLWFVEGGGMYVYYTPTHWRERT